MKNKAWAIVPAAGSGRRMQSDIPKQYLSLAGRPVISHTLERLARHSEIAGIVVAIAADDDRFAGIELALDKPMVTVTGGENRADSVRAALSWLCSQTDTPDWVLVHDAARPCIRLSDLDQMFQLLRTNAVGGVLGMPVSDTVKRTDATGRIIETVCREQLWRAATPQMFPPQVLLEALSDAHQQGLVITDEASAIESTGQQPQMVVGHADNIKITVSADLALAEHLLQLQENH